MENTPPPSVEAYPSPLQNEKGDLTPATRVFHVSDGHSDRCVSLFPPLGLDLEAVVTKVVVSLSGLPRSGRRGNKKVCRNKQSSASCLIVVSINEGNVLTAEPFQHIVARILASIEDAKRVATPSYFVSATLLRLSLPPSLLESARVWG